MNTHKYTSAKLSLWILSGLMLVVCVPGLFPNLFPAALALEPPIINFLGIVIALGSAFLTFTLPKAKYLIPNFDKILTQQEESSKPTPEPKNTNEELIHLLAMLQKEGRLLDFVMQDISGFDEKHIAAAARYVHDHCGKFIKDNFDIQAVHPSEEGTPITILNENISQYQFLNSDKPAKSGILVHRGWKVGQIKFKKLPKTNHSITNLITPAQVKVTAQEPNT